MLITIIFERQWYKCTNVFNIDWIHKHLHGAWSVLSNFFMCAVMLCNLFNDSQQRNWQFDFMSFCDLDLFLLQSAFVTIKRNLNQSLVFCVRSYPEYWWVQEYRLLIHHFWQSVVLLSPRALLPQAWFSASLLAFHNNFKPQPCFNNLQGLQRKCLWEFPNGSLPLALTCWMEISSHS